MWQSTNETHTHTHSTLREEPDEITSAKALYSSTGTLLYPPPPPLRAWCVLALFPYNIISLVPSLSLIFPSFRAPLVSFHFISCHEKKKKRKKERKPIPLPPPCLPTILHRWIAPWCRNAIYILLYKPIKHSTVSFIIFIFLIIYIFLLS